MKKKSLFGLFVLLFIMGCSKDNSSEQISNDETLKALVDNAEVAIEVGSFSATIQNPISNLWQLEISCNSTSTNECYHLKIYGNIGPDNLFFQVGQVGEYEFFDLEYIKNGEIWINSYNNNPSNIPVGAFTITELNETELKGTFSFIGYNVNDDSTKTITEGVFNVPYVRF